MNLSTKICISLHTPTHIRLHCRLSFSLGWTKNLPHSIRNQSTIKYEPSHWTFGSTSKSDHQEIHAPSLPFRLHKTRGIDLDRTFPFHDELEQRYLRRVLRPLLENPIGPDNRRWELIYEGTCIEKLFIFENIRLAKVRQNPSKDTLYSTIRIYKTNIIVQDIPLIYSCVGIY